MSILDRKSGPFVTNAFDLRISDVKSQVLNNGVRLYELNTGTQDILKIELVFRAGRIHENKPAVSKAAIKLLREGSSKRSSEETAYAFDYHGAVFKAECSMEYSSVSLVCLGAHFKELWPVWLDSILNPSFPEDELEKYREIRSKGLKNQLTKNEIIAYRELTVKIFGQQHPYGYNTEPEDILNVQRDDLVDFYKQNCSLSNAFLVMSGHYSDDIRDAVVESLGSADPGNTLQEKDFPQAEKNKGEFLIKTNNDLQSSIKMGCLWVPRNHEDFVALRFLNTVLGGYFGSRLMKNIREDKGYTYGIYSAFDAWQREGYFYISTEMGSEYIERGVAEIFTEIKKLREKGVYDDELKMVKNYLLGQSLNLIDGPFATAQLVKSLKAKDLDLSIFENAVKEIRELDNTKLKSLADQYLRPEDFTIVYVGQK